MINEYMLQNLENFEKTLSQLKQNAEVELPEQITKLEQRIIAMKVDIEYVTKLVEAIKQLKQEQTVPTGE